MTDRAKPDPKPDEIALEPWRAGITLALLVLGIATVAIASSIRISGSPRWQNIQALLVSAIALAGLLLRRRAGHTNAIATIVIFGSMLVMITANQLVPPHEWPFPPLIGFKIAVISIALVASSAALGMGLIAACLITAVIVTAMLGSVDLEFEPWATLGIGAGALAILLYRERLKRMRHAFLREQATRATAQQVALTLLAMRDLANTPLQTLTLTTELLVRRHPDDPLLERMQRALAQLGRLNEILVAAETDLQRESPARTISFDALQEIEAALGKTPSGSG